MKKTIILLTLILISLSSFSQGRLLGTVIDWTPAANTDSTVYNNLFFEDNVEIGIAIECTTCDSVYFKPQWANRNVSSAYATMPISQNGSAVDSILLDGTTVQNIWIPSTPYQYGRIVINQSSNDKATRILITRNYVRKNTIFRLKEIFKEVMGR